MMARAVSITAPRSPDRQRVMVTPEGIALRVTVANRGSRIGALVFDFGLMLAMIIATTLLLVYIASGTTDLLGRYERDSAASRAAQFLMIVWIAAIFLFRNAYFLFFELGPRGATPGKRIAGIRIAARDGGRLSAEMVIARNLLRDVELFLPLVFLAALGSDDAGAASLAAAGWFLIFAGMPCFNRDALRAGDIIAGTWVIEAPRRGLAPAMSAAQDDATAIPAAASYVFTPSELAVYGEYELQMLERVLREDRGETLDAVHQTIAAKIGRAPQDWEARPFLEGYYTQLRGRLEAGMRMGQRKADKFAGS